MRPLAEGRVLGAFGLTEPDAGSDARGISTRAERRDGGWLINGRKTFISNAGTDMSFGVTLLARTPSADGQGVQFKLADIATELEAARWLTYRAAHLRDSGRPFRKEAAMAKLKASRVAAWAASEAVQIHGGVGYMLESPVARFYCDSKVLEIGEGTNEIQHLVIARELGC